MSEMTLKEIVTRARALRRLLDEAKKMESQRIGAVSMDNYIKASVRFVDDVSRIKIQDGALGE